MKKFFYLALVIPIVLTSCNSSPEKEVPFIKEYLAKGELYMLGENLTDPRFINITDKYFIIGNTKGEPLIEVYDVSTKFLLNKFLYIGNGPSEVLVLGNFQGNTKQDNMYVYDFFKHRLFQYNVSESAQNEKIEPRMIFERGEDSPLLYDKMYVGNDYFIAESRDPRGRIILIDKNTHEATYFLSYPDKKYVNTTLSDIVNASLYATNITVNPSLDRVALGTYGAGMLDICQIKNGELVSIWSHFDFYPEGIMVIPMGEQSVAANTKDSRDGYTFVCSTDKYVYALYSGRKLEEKKRASDEVRVVSWNGKETYKIILDRPIERLGVDLNDKFIYGITSEMDILRFPIKK